MPLVWHLLPGLGGELASHRVSISRLLALGLSGREEQDPCLRMISSASNTIVTTRTPIESYSRDIKMNIGVDICTIIHNERGKFTKGRNFEFIQCLGEQKIKKRSRQP